MTSWPSRAARAVDATFRRFGRAATYRPAEGAALAVTTIDLAPDAVARLGGSSLHLGAATALDVRAAEVPTPGAGDRIDLADGRVLIVQGEPLADADRLVWRLDTRPARPGEMA